MIGTTGQRFLQCLEAATSWEPGQQAIERPIHKVFELYQPDFIDSSSVLVVIDEIQDSPVVYSKIREFSREFKCHFIVTGSYLGKTREKEYFLSAGDVESLTMTSLTFPEFLDAFEIRDLYERIYLYGESDHDDYDKLKQYFDIYLHIGGYPEVVKTYVETKSMESCADMIENLVSILQRNLPDILIVLWKRLHLIRFLLRLL